MLTRARPPCRVCTQALLCQPLQPDPQAEDARRQAGGAVHCQEGQGAADTRRRPGPHPRRAYPAAQAAWGRTLGAALPMICDPPVPSNATATRCAHLLTRCHSPRLQVPRLRPAQYSSARLSKSKKTVHRAYGGVLSGGAVRDRVVRAFLVDEQKIVKKVRRCGTPQPPGVPGTCSWKPLGNQTPACWFSTQPALIGGVPLAGIEAAGTEGSSRAEEVSSRTCSVPHASSVNVCSGYPLHSQTGTRLLLSSCSSRHGVVTSHPCSTFEDILNAIHEFSSAEHLSHGQCLIVDGCVVLWNNSQAENP